MLGNKGTGREYRDGGCRGGADQFKWDDVKADAYRENYLGHSIHAPVGRWQKGRDIQWYAKKPGDASEHITSTLKRPNDDIRKAEIAAIKKMEEDILHQELGLALKKRSRGDTPLDKEEMKLLLARGNTTREQTDVERVEGLGAAPAKRHDHIPKLTLVEQEIARRERQEREGALVNVNEVSSNARIDDGGDRAERKREKKEKKEKKREKKEHKKEMKGHKSHKEKRSGSEDGKK